ncbi:hypothetical protein BH11BAC1_BH11BAC1_15660 [soil metagenome]
MKLTATFLFLLQVMLSPTFAQSFSGPESVEFDPINNRYIVSNTTSGNLQSVVPGSLPTLFTANVSSPYGLVVVDSTIYVNDNGKVLGFNLVTGLQTFTSNVNGTFLNGICADTSGHIYTTDFNAKKIYKVNIADASSSVYVSATVKTPNGILFDAANNRLIYCTWGSGVQIKAVSLVDSSQTILKTTTLSNDDGIAMDGQGRIYISIWGTQSAYMLDSAFVNAPVQVITGLSSPADICYNINNDTLGVPNSGNNTVKFYNMAYILSLPKQAATTEFLKTSADEEGVHLDWELKNVSSASLQIFSLTGAMISCEDVMPAGTHVIQKGKLKSGIYFARVMAGEKERTEKFFVD